MSVRRLSKRSPSALALLFVAALATAQFGLLAMMIASQRDGAHIINFSGAQRMRTQRIAYLALAAHDGTADPGWRDELLAAVRQMRAVRFQMASRALTRTTSITTVTPLGRRVEAFLAAAETIARDPKNTDALREIRRDRLPLLAAAEASVQVRTTRIQNQNDHLLEAFALGLLGLFGTIFVAWRYILVPGERKTAEAIAELVDSRRQFRSLFGENPEAVAIYDLDGRILRGNRAAVALIGHSGQALLGDHFTEHLAPASVDAANAAFVQAAAGGTATFETVFRGRDGELIDVATSLFPSIVKGKVTGVFGVAKDLRDLKRVQTSYKELADRMSALYKVAAGTGGTRDQQIDEALSVACAELHCEAAFLAEAASGMATVCAVSGTVLQPGFSAPLPDPRAQSGGESPDTMLVTALARGAWPGDDAKQAGFVDSVIGLPVAREGVWFGTLAVIATPERKNSLDQADRDFLGLVSALVGSALARGQQERKLDALAFFDGLTGLPNRALLNDRLAVLVESANRSGETFALHYIDLDRFKDVNDGHGHAVGDRVLQIAARRMESVLRSTDTVARIGGDEFVVLQPGAHDRSGAQDVAERLLLAVADPFVIEGVEHRLGASIGISLYPEDGRDGQTLMQRADDALYRAKAGGKNRLNFAA
jgi:diguanylate cyclase (GGDEF)-like protein/PAS domain S-box-containing protein